MFQPLSVLTLFDVRGAKTAWFLTAWKQMDGKSGHFLLKRNMVKLESLFAFLYCLCWLGASKEKMQKKWHTRCIRLRWCNNKLLYTTILTTNFDNQYWHLILTNNVNNKFWQPISTTNVGYKCWLQMLITPRTTNIYYQSTTKKYRSVDQLGPRVASASWNIFQFSLLGCITTRTFFGG